MAIHFSTTSTFSIFRSGCQSLPPNLVGNMARGCKRTNSWIYNRSITELIINLWKYSFMSNYLHQMITCRYGNIMNYQDNNTINMLLHGSIFQTLCLLQAKSRSTDTDTDASKASEMYGINSSSRPDRMKVVYCGNKCWSFHNCHDMVT